MLKSSEGMYSVFPSSSIQKSSFLLVAAAYLPCVRRKEVKTSKYCEDDDLYWTVTQLFSSAIEFQVLRDDDADTAFIPAVIEYLKAATDGSGTISFLE